MLFILSPGRRLNCFSAVVAAHFGKAVSVENIGKTTVDSANKS